MFLLTIFAVAIADTLFVRHLRFVRRCGIRFRSSLPPFDMFYRSRRVVTRPGPSEHVSEQVGTCPGGVPQTCKYILRNA